MTWQKAFWNVTAGAEAVEEASSFCMDRIYPTRSLYLVWKDWVGLWRIRGIRRVGLKMGFSIPLGPRSEIEWASDWAEIDQGPWAFDCDLGRGVLNQGRFVLIGSAQAGSICLKIGTHNCPPSFYT